MNKGIGRKLVLSLLLVILPMIAWSSGRGERRGEIVLLEIGREDEDYSEFASRGFRDLEEFHCSTDQVLSAEEFLFAHFIEGVIADRGVSRVVIDFTLGQRYERVVLRLAREGSETTVVTVDEGTEFQVTADMLGSRDGNHFGAYDLVLGSLEEGEHTIVLTVLDEGKSGSGYVWDALKLLAR